MAFSEQALSYRDNHQSFKVTRSLNSPDDKLPVSCIPENLHGHKGHVHIHFLNGVSLFFLLSEHVCACAIDSVGALEPKEDALIIYIVRQAWQSYSNCSPVSCCRSVITRKSRRWIWQHRKNYLHTVVFVLDCRPL